MEAGEQLDGDEDNTPSPAWMSNAPKESWLKAKIVSIFWTVVNLLRTPAYSIPLVVNLTGSIWFFLLVGQHGMYSGECLICGVACFTNGYGSFLCDIGLSLC